ncbi:MAG: hypothetical protein IM592_17620 [Bacteroidetes bacterium]|nr:hypothetical protein [Bacteroidota bacterium]
MNIIQKQAADFVRYNMSDHDEYKEFIDKVRSQLWEYKKVSYKIEFVEYIINKAKIAFDEHLPKCTSKNNCPVNKYYENTLFFLQEELEELESELKPEDFSRSEKASLNQTLQKIVEDLNTIKLGQQITYDDVKDEFEELKDLYYLNKKNWVQLFTGKLSEMVAGGVISETISKDLAEIIKNSYKDLISSNI